MYPEQNLTRLGLHKASLRKRIARRRTEWAGYVDGVLQPVEYLDRLLALGRRIAPLAKLALVPLGWLLLRGAAPRRGLVSNLLRWGPFAFGLLRTAAKLGRR